MTAARSSHPAVSVVVDPGPPPYPAAWDIEVRGPLDVAALQHALGGPASGEPGRRHRLIRLGPHHHKLRLTDTAGESAAALAGRVADLLTRPTTIDQPLSPAQCAVLARAGEHRYEAMYLEPATPPDAATVRDVLHTVLAAHPQLRARLDTTGARLTGGAGTGPTGHQNALMEREPTDGADGDTRLTGGAGAGSTARRDALMERASTDGADRDARLAAGTRVGPTAPHDPLVEAEFADESDFTAAVAAVGRTIDPPAGIRLRALLARDRRPTAPHAAPRTDRLVLLVDELAVDDSSWQTLLDDLTTALAERGAMDAARPVADGTENTTQPARATGAEPCAPATDTEATALAGTDAETTARVTGAEPCAPATDTEATALAGTDAETTARVTGAGPSVAATGAEATALAGTDAEITARVTGAGPSVVATGAENTALAAAAEASGPAAAAEAPGPATDAETTGPATPAENTTPAKTTTPATPAVTTTPATPAVTTTPATPAEAPVPLWRVPDGSGAGHVSVSAQHEGGGAAEWVGGLRELAVDADEARHWGRVAERRVRVAGARWAAAGQRRAGDAAEAAGPAGLWDSGPGTARQFGFVVEQGPTERIVHGLARRFALTAGQALTGVFALALARWQRADEVGLDVRSDPRTDHPGLRRHVGRLTDLHPVQLTVDPLLDPLEQLAAVAGALAAGAGHAEDGAGFGACREWSPDPLLRAALRELPPAQACLTLPGPGEALPVVPARPVPGLAPPRPAYPLHARIQVVGGRLHVGLEWTPVPAEGITETSVSALAELLRQLLEELAEASTAPIPSAFRATPQQSALYKGGDAQPGTGRHVEQVVWIWHGPLDVARFTVAWQSVFDRETVLRTAFTGGSDPQLMVHSRVTPEITTRFHRADDLSALLEHDRLRGFDLRCPGALRLTLLAADGIPRPGTPTRIVLTYHRALLDNWSAHVLLREFYRAYLAGGALPGGERRPDLRDYTAWIAAQDLGPARGFWALSAPPDGTATAPGRPAGATGLTGVGRSRLRLDPAETIRLARWAGRWGIAESGVLQAVWAMLIYRASGATAPAPVCFAVTVPGRGIPLDGVSRMPGPLRNSLLMSVEVDPAGTVLALLRQLRDRALDMAAYEWVPGDWIHGRREADAEPADTMIVFEDPPHPVEGLENELAAQGLGADFPGTVPARSVLPIGLLAHHDRTGGLVFTGVHDRDVLDEEAAGELLVQSALLLRELPLWARESTTVAEALKLLEGRAVPPMAETAGPGPDDDPLVTLRAAQHEQAGTICLIPPPGAPADCYDLLAHTYTGPRQLLVLTTGADTDRARSALAELPHSRPLTLGGYSGAGTLACDLAHHLTSDNGHPPSVVLTGTYPPDRHQAEALTHALTQHQA